MPERYAWIEPDTEGLATRLSEWRRQSATLGLLALVPEAETARVPAIQGVCRDLGLNLIGAIVPALVTDGGFVARGILLIGLDPMPPCFLLDHLNAGARTAHSRISAAIRACAPPLAGAVRPTVFFIFDATIPNIGSILNGVYRDLRDRVCYAGINVGSETFQPIPCLFDRDTLVSNGVAGLLLPGSPVVVSHGYPVAKTLMRAIATKGNRISVIDQRPALEVYQEVIQADFGIRLTRENFYDYAVHFPFGLVMADEVVVRIPVALEENGTIVCVGEVPPNSVLRLIRAPSLDESPCVRAIAEGLGRRSAAPRESLLTFYCAGRRLHLGDAATAELGQLREATGVAHLVGALSLGEVSSLAQLGSPVFHNAALVCVDRDLVADPAHRP